ncbi:MAG: metallophosphoesterase family protein [Flavobacteriales bacterium]|jgi:putative phosphoesterase
MKRIGLISDTHGYLDERVFVHFESCDEIWHAGDIGDIQVIRALQAFRPVKAVFGNIDGNDIRSAFPEHLRWNCEGLDVWITHIGGRPGNYATPVRSNIQSNPPGLFVCGHSHLCLVQFDQKGRFLYMNPGAAGKHGFHKVRTLLRFSVSGGKAGDLEVIELGPRAQGID